MSIFQFGGINKHYPKITNILNPEQIRNISESWKKHYEYFKATGLIENLRSTNYYHSSIDNCIKIIGGSASVIVGCRTVYSCNIEPIAGFECIQVNQKWSKKTLIEGEFDAYVPLGPSVLEVKHNGCTLD